ncbi:hypothetical protein Poly51_44820 [Rubripirellula tenax]|uniref:Uncharacterized protein n=1 Tax=Rubripirellula tenax TaxID=2528015 RepID=A0A5C6EHU7_9BACT|nr:hypothetical protein Poly51_44820 [Rubripirellula tenax]
MNAVRGVPAPNRKRHSMMPLLKNEKVNSIDKYSHGLRSFTNGWPQRLAIGQFDRIGGC